MIRFGTVGTGWITDAFISGTLLRQELELTAVCSRDRAKGEAFGARYGTPAVFTDPAAMAESNLLDAVYIASPNVLHGQQARLFLEHGKHVICEKPIAVTPEELASLQQLAEEKGLVYMEAIMMMHLPAREALKKAVGQIGRVTTASFDFSQLSSKYPAYERGETPNIFNPVCCTGSLMDLGIYCVYPALDLFGEPEEISASAGFLRTGADGWGTAVLRYPDKQVTLTWSKVGQSRLGSQILGDQGTVTLESISCLTGIRRWEKDGTAHTVWSSEEKATLMGWEAHSFARFIRDPAGTRPEQAEVARMAMAVSRVMAEIRRKAGIHFPGWEEHDR
ncbi:MAG: Gfo/Idh/MocA family oxidoreductase [Oscillospiraceae bacterium]|nr:Gfo/Idh/MocA family oxidoreductase [Oscillospiraceae bacterium]